MRCCERDIEALVDYRHRAPLQCARIRLTALFAFLLLDHWLPPRLQPGATLTWQPVG